LLLCSRLAVAAQRRGGLRRLRGVALALTHFFAPALLQAVP
jgi:hypothetical protein